MIHGGRNSIVECGHHVCAWPGFWADESFTALFVCSFIITTETEDPACVDVVSFWLIIIWACPGITILETSQSKRLHRSASSHNPQIDLYLCHIAFIIAVVQRRIGLYVLLIGQRNGRESSMVEKLRRRMFIDDLDLVLDSSRDCCTAEIKIRMKNIPMEITHDLQSVHLPQGKLPRSYRVGGFIWSIYQRGNRQLTAVDPG